MSDGDIRLEVDVRSNVDRLSVRRIHEGLADITSGMASDGADLLREIVPRGDTLGLLHAVAHSPSVETDGLLLARVGVRPVDTATTTFFSPNTRETISPGSSDARNYPEMVDRGTGVFGPTTSPIFARRVNNMRFLGDEGFLIFRHEVAGQRGQHFMEQTYTSMHLFFRARVERFKALMEQMGAEARADL